jgi:hypothetical protein
MEDASSPGSDDLALADKIGMCLSLSCAAHCAAAPLLIAGLAAAGFELALGDFWHSLFLLGTCLLAAANFTRSFRRHRRPEIWPLFLLAATTLAAGRFAGEGPHETMLMAGGGLLLAVCHLLNHRYCRECRK